MISALAPMVARFERRANAFAARWALPVWPLAVVALVLLSAFAYGPLFAGGLILTGDTAHAVRVFEMGRCLGDGQLPCRWVPDLGNGYGYPLFNYYPPLPYYAGDLIHRLGLSYLRTADVLFALGLIGAGVSMFVLARRLWGDLGGLVSALAYVYAPYLALDVYMRGALAELWALALAPALLWALHELITTGRARYVPVAALLGALLLLSHNLVVVILAPAVALWTLAFLLRGRDRGRRALLAGAAGLWTAGLAAFFTLPVLFEGDQVQLDSLTRWPFHYSVNFASVADLFLLRTADYSFLLGGREDTPVQIGWFHWGLAALSLPAAALLLRSGQRAAALAIGLLAAFFAVGAFMSTSASEPVWDAFGPLRFVQFPWRYLGLVSLASAALAGAWLAVLRERPSWLRLAVAAALIGLFIAGGETFFHAEHRLDISDEEFFSAEHFDSYRVSSINDYLPAAVEEVPELAAAPARVIEGTARVTNAGSGSDWLRLRIEAQSPARIEAAVFDYPNWRVRIDGEGVPHEASQPYGLIAFDVPAGTHEADLRLEDTAVRRAGNLFSLASWGVLVLAGTVAAGRAARRLRRSAPTP